jgi:hypothetical protein
VNVSQGQALNVWRADINNLRLADSLRNQSCRSANVIENRVEVEQIESELLTNFSDPLICGHDGQTSRVSPLCLSALGGK